MLTPPLITRCCILQGERPQRHKKGPESSTIRRAGQEHHLLCGGRTGGLHPHYEQDLQGAEEGEDRGGGEPGVGRLGLQWAYQGKFIETKPIH